MRGLKGFSIRQKIFFIILIVTVISIITGFTIEILSNVRASRNDLKSNITLDAKLIGDYLMPAYLFEDKQGAKNILQKLANIPSVVIGAAYDANGNLYAEYSPEVKSDSVKSLSAILKFEKDKNVILVTERINSGKD